MHYKPPTEEECEAIHARHMILLEMEIDTSDFSPRLKQAIATYEETMAKQRATYESGLDYLRRTQTAWTDDERLAYIWFSAIIGKSIRNFG